MGEKRFTKEKKKPKQNKPKPVKGSEGSASVLPTSKPKRPAQEG